MASKLESLRDDVDPESSLDAKIRERAYYLWKNAGEPDGLDVEHWLQARQEHDGPGESPQALVDARLVPALGASSVTTASTSR